MATNELFPFANGEDANILPTTQWQALADILENGFQSGIARSEQVNRVLAQGAVASYVLGQLIVDQLNQNATLDETTLYQNLVSALQENAKDACLPLGGGTMTNTIKTSALNGLTKSNASGELRISGGTSYSDGAHIKLFGKDSSSNKGYFSVVAQDGANVMYLTGTPNGALTWDGKTVLTTANGLPLTGGEMTGNITFNKSECLLNTKESTQDMRIGGGGGYSTGTVLYMFGKESTRGQGFYLRTVNRDGNTYQLTSDGYGSLDWKGESVQNPVGTVIAYASNSAPNGYLICNGSAVSRTTYAKLFEAIGTTYGSGDGSTTFNLPNLTDKFIQGSGTAGTVKSAGLPNIVGSLYSVPDAEYTNGGQSGAFSDDGAISSVFAGSNRTELARKTILDASKYNSIYGNSTSVQPPALTMRYYIKY